MVAVLFRLQFEVGPFALFRQVLIEHLAELIGKGGIRIGDLQNDAAGDQCALVPVGFLGGLDFRQTGFEFGFFVGKGRHGVSPNLKRIKTSRIAVSDGECKLRS